MLSALNYQVIQLKRSQTNSQYCVSVFEFNLSEKKHISTN